MHVPESMRLSPISKDSAEHGPFVELRRLGISVQISASIQISCLLVARVFFSLRK